jgi:hypothetical protein
MYLVRNQASGTTFSAQLNKIHIVLYQGCNLSIDKT